MSDLLAQLGLSQEAITEMIVNRAVVSLVESTYVDEETGTTETRSSSFHRKIERLVTKKIDDAITQLGDTKIVPEILGKLETFVIQKTNTFGEPKGPPVTFVEHVMERAEAYCSEKVNSKGLSKAEENDYRWEGKQSRLSYFLNQHLQQVVKQAVETIIGDANKTFAASLEEVVKLKLAEVTTALKVSVRSEIAK